MLLHRLLSLTLAIVMLGGTIPPAMAEGAASQTVVKDFTMQPETRWRFFTDQVMGGISQGNIAFEQDGTIAFARMTGSVSTANRGGFIQMRLDLVAPPPEGTTGVRLVVRGNAERYFVHLRTAGTLLPWQYYQAGFDVTESWAEVWLPLDAFSASGALLRTVPKPGSLKSVAVVAYGRNHEARIDVSEVGFY